MKTFKQFNESIKSAMLAATGKNNVGFFQKIKSLFTGDWIIPVQAAKEPGIKVMKRKGFDDSEISEVRKILKKSLRNVLENEYSIKELKKLGLKESEKNFYGWLIPIEVRFSDTFITFWEREIEKLMKNLNESKSDYKIKHETMSAAFREVEKKLDKMGYEMDEDDYFLKVASGPKKPSKGKTNKYTIEINNVNGKKTRKQKYVQVQIYGLQSGNYELNTYV